MHMTCLDESENNNSLDGSDNSLDDRNNPLDDRLSRPLGTVFFNPSERPLPTRSASRSVRRRSAGKSL